MNLRSDMRQNIQTELDFSSTPAGEAREAGREETESPPVVRDPESPASTNRLMEVVCERENLKEALRRVKANKGSAGVDGMTVGGITDYLKQHWPAIRGQLLSGTYEPKPVRRVEIPKADGGIRKLGIPTMLDRLIQQAVMQVLQRQRDPTFSAGSYKEELQHYASRRLFCRRPAPVSAQKLHRHVAAIEAVIGHGGRYHCLPQAEGTVRAYITRMGFGKGPTKSGLSYGLYCRRIKSWPLLLLLLSHPACAISPPAW